MRFAVALIVLTSQIASSLVLPGGLLNAKRMPTSSSSSSVGTSTALGAGKTLYDKIFESHTVYSEDGSTMLYIDRHLVHEVTSPQAFEGLKIAGRGVRRPDCTLLTVDHNVPTSDRKDIISVETFIEESASRTQVLKLDENAKEFGLKYFNMCDQRQGIVHVIGPDQGFTVPGATCVCGDSHTATHGAFGALAFGIGTSEVEHVLATSCLGQAKAKNFKIQIDGELAPGVTSKDIILHVIGIIGTAGGTGSVIEFAGSACDSLTMEARMSISNMAIEAGARAGLFAPDETTYDFLRGRPMCPKGGDWDKAVQYWETLKSDEDAAWDRVVEIDAADIAPTITWGTSPQDVAPIDGCTPKPETESDAARKAAIERALDYIGLEGGQVLEGVPIDVAFIGSCTNGRIEDVREVAAIAEGRKVADNVQALVVPGSGLVKLQAEEEGLDKILTEAGFEWREPSCSMCLAMNPDKLKPQERCASTSNRNFEGRQGNGGRTHLMSPAMAAAAAVSGKLADVRKFPYLGQEDPRKGKGAFSKAFSTEVYKNPGPIISPTPPYLERDGGGKGGGAAGLPPFTVLKAKAAPLDIQNIDTDMIIPKEFLKTINRSGLGYAAFAELRYKNAEEVAIKGAEFAERNEDFVLNKPEYAGTKILVTGDNFGCGSSREHAPWAIEDEGIRCIISTSFADIFYNNCFNNGMLPVKLDRSSVEELLKDVEGGNGEIIVDLPSQTVTSDVTGKVYDFEIDEFRKNCLINGLDKIGLTLENIDKIAEFEKARSKQYPWLDGASMMVPDTVKMYDSAPIWEIA